FNRSHPGELVYNNLIMTTELIEAARLAKVEKFIALGTICSYPEIAPLPFHEEDLWNGYPAQPTAAHGIVQRTVLTQLQAYRSQYDFNGIMLIPTNFYGPGDHLRPESLRLIPALIQKMLLAKKTGQSFIEMTGNSKSTLDLLYIDDAAKGIIAAAEHHDGADPVNIGSGREISLREITDTLCLLLDFRGEIRWLNEQSMPVRRAVDISKAKQYFEFQARTGLETGLKETIAWYHTVNTL
ncbi:MAG: NAD-dependent epimerase/dehydratase family protein, partial [Patescibacteria group bacterium]